MKLRLITALMIFSVVFGFSCSFNTVFAETDVTEPVEEPILEPIEEPVVDTEAPMIENMLLSENSVYQGTNIKISLKVTDESGISDILVRYTIPTGGNRDVKGFSLNSETGYYESVIELGEEAALGIWSVYGIMTQDTLGNYEWVMNSNSYVGTDYNVKDFSSLDFIVTEEPSDKEPPVINTQSFEVSVNELYQGESFKVSVEATDESGIKDIIVRYKMSVGGTKDITGFVYNEETGKYEAELVVPEDATPGVWKVYGIMAQDNFDNHTWVMNVNTYEENLYEKFDISQGDINVLEVWKDKYAPVIEEVTVSKTRAASENKIVISLKITEDTEIKDITVRLNKANNKTVDVKGFVYNEETGLYEATYQIPADAVLGVWKIYGIMAQDTLNNFTWTMNSNLYTGTSYPLMDLSHTDINVVETVHIESISVKESNVTLKENESSDIEIIYSPEDVTDDIIITYTSSNEAVARVEGNKIIAVAAGEAIITVNVNGITTEVSVIVEKEEVITPEEPEIPEEPGNDPEEENKYCCLDLNKDGKVNCKDLYIGVKFILKCLFR